MWAHPVLRWVPNGTGSRVRVRWPICCPCLSHVTRRSDLRGDRRSSGVTATVGLCAVAHTRANCQAPAPFPLLSLGAPHCLSAPSTSAMAAACPAQGVLFQD
ncbi:hypothetical protein AAFF_G00262300 [Aldrovandia affinis]|uniref:Uncharacterized protein n=1 Tax=Aldrovandia affinis TaxID=143900 RepID=A0AAD7SSF9_9TELE|nr:hypothetical protein AAFF_G00262300 [Aldrovandia affinis]